MARKSYKVQYKMAHKNLQLRGRRWFYRRSVPVELRERMGCSEITRSLKTESVTEAERTVATLDREVTALIDAARTDNLLDLEKLISDLTGKYLRQLIAQDRSSRRTGEFGPRAEYEDMQSYYAEQARDMDEDLDRRKFDSVRDEATALLAAEGVSLEGEALEGLLYQLLHTKIRARVQTIKELSGDIKLQADEPLAEPTRTAPAVSSPPSKPLGEVVQRYIKERVGSGAWTSARAASDRERELKFLITELGEDKMVAEITADDILDARGVLEEGRKTGTVAKIVGNWTALFNWSEKMGYSTRNPARHLRPKKKAAREQRFPFTHDEIEKLFGPRLREVSLDKGRDERWWVSLLALFTGARVNELAQLEVWDSQNERGIDHLYITGKALAPDGQTEKQPLKNDSSERRIPLHPDLIRLGFLDYVAEVKGAGHRRVFHQLRSTADRGPGTHISGWFTLHRRKVGVDGAGKAFHSFRHSFSDSLREAGAEEANVALLLGQVHPNITFGTYGRAALLTETKQVIELLDYRQPLRALFPDS